MSTISEFLPAAAELVQALKKDSPQIMILAGGAAAIADPPALLMAGCSQVCWSRNEARRLIRGYGLRRAKGRVVGTSRSAVSRAHRS